MLTTSESRRDESQDMDLESLPHDPLEMHPHLFPPPPPGRGRALDASMLRLPSHTRAFSHSPQPSYSGDLDTNPISRHSHPDLGYLRNSSRFEDTLDLYLPQSTTAIEDFLDESLMAAHYLDVPNHCSNIPQDYDPSYPHSDSSVSSPEAAASDTASSSSPRAEIFSAHSSPGYLLQDLPDAMETARPRSGFSHYLPVPHHLGLHGGDNHMDHENGYHQSLVLPRPTSYDSHMHQRPVNTWGYPPSALPSISQSSRYAISRPPSPSTFGQFPVADDLRRWPQIFKINQAKRGGSKKQMMACLFCRERKIGCARPPEDEPDQTCNQCARRKRKCVYPTESRRGQHTRNRLGSKKFLGLEESKDNPVTPPQLPGTK